MIKLLSTKQLSEKSIAYAQSLRFETTCVDFIETTPVLWRESDLINNDCQIVAFTSSSGVRYFLQHPFAQEWIKDKQIYSIAGQTAEELERHGLSPIITAQDSLILTEGVIEKQTTNCVVHVCGNMRLKTLEQKLTNAGIKYYPLVVYNTTLKTDIHLEEEYDVILFFSPSGVKGFLSANEISEKVICCCIGNTTAAELRQRVSNAKIVISPFPSPKSMIERAAKYFETRS
jgi:uroporphyrinogen-III synthase